MNSLDNLYLRLRKAAPTILSYVGVLGVAATTIEAIKTTPRAMELIRHDSRLKHDGDPYAYTKLEAVKSAWKCYIPTALYGLSTIACILGSNVLNKRQQATITSAYMLLSNTYKEIAKNDTDGEARKAAVQEKDVHPALLESDDALFYEFNHGEFFNRKYIDVLSAEYTFNQKFLSKGYACLNDFYELIGLPKSPIGYELGWCITDGYPWVDFEHELIKLEDGMECYLIHLPDPPIPDYI